MNTVSLFSGAGGLDIGFIRAGFNVVWANDFNLDACKSYKKNIGNHIKQGDIGDFKKELYQLNNIDLIIGGPPCQGFSVAGKMDPNDSRNKLIWEFAEAIEKIKPKAFVMENVKALGKLKKWENVRSKLLARFRDAGYSVNYIVLNASEYGVPQSRERVFFIGFLAQQCIVPDLSSMLAKYKEKAATVRETLLTLDKAGEGNNTSICNAKIVLATNPILRRSPYAGMLFNGLGRPINLDGYSSTLSASMGGNKTPIIDENALYRNSENWIISYHSELMSGNKNVTAIPKSLRRITVEEAAMLQTFPVDYKFEGSQSSRYRQIGNAVPCNLSYNIARMVYDHLTTKEIYGQQVIGAEMIYGY